MIILLLIAKSSDQDPSENTAYVAIHSFRHSVNAFAVTVLYEVCPLTVFNLIQTTNKVSRSTYRMGKANNK